MNQTTKNKNYSKHFMRQKTITKKRLEVILNLQRHI
jgi:hypothetical protein